MSVDKFSSLKARNRDPEGIRQISGVRSKWRYDRTGGFNGKQAGRMEALERLTEDAALPPRSHAIPGPTGDEPSGGRFEG
jgi:hypothetical protein